MTTKIKNNAKTNKTNKTVDAKNDTKNDTKKSLTVQPTDNRPNHSQTADYADPSTTLNSKTDIPIDTKIVGNDTDNSIIYHVGEIRFDDGTIIQKLFRVDRMPTHAVLVMYVNPDAIGALDAHHVLTYSKSEKICKSHVQRVKKQYIGDNATVTPNYYTDKIEIVRVLDRGMPTSDVDPNKIEDKSWARARNAARKLALAASNPAAVSAAAIALNTAVLKNYIS